MMQFKFALTEVPVFMLHCRLDNVPNEPGSQPVSGAVPTTSLLLKTLIYDIGPRLHHDNIIWNESSNVKCTNEVLNIWQNNI